MGRRDYYKITHFAKTFMCDNKFSITHLDHTAFFIISVGDELITFDIDKTVVNEV